MHGCPCPPGPLYASEAGNLGNLRAVGTQIMMQTGVPGAYYEPFRPRTGDGPTTTRREQLGDRIDALEQELRALRAHQAMGQGGGLGGQPGQLVDLGIALNGAPHMPAVPNLNLQHLPSYSHASSLSQAASMQLAAVQQPPSCRLGTATSDADVTARGSATSRSSKEHQDVLSAHRELLERMDKQQEQHEAMLESHRELMKVHKDILNGRQNGGKKQKKPHPALGVIRLDYEYPPAEGDIDCPGSYGYDVYYRVIPKLTFKVAQDGKFSDTVERSFAEGIKYLEQRGVSAITGDCGFMMAFQVLARKIATKPVFMSSMVQCPVVAAALDPRDQILILTANEWSLKPQKEILLSSCGFDVEAHRFIIKGCQDIPGFDAVAKGEKVPLDVVQPAIVKLTQQTITKFPKIRAILLECTELPPYADALRAATGLPVWDAITCADFYVGACRDNPRFGLSDWQAEWDEEQEEYSFGANLVSKERTDLTSQVRGTSVCPKAKAKAKAKASVAKTQKKLAKMQSPILGVVRLDYNYPPAKGDIDCPASYDYEVLFRSVPGLTFQMAQSGRMNYTVEQDFVAAIKWLESKGASGITGDCGFMMAFQDTARRVATVPVFMSAMVQCPMISVAFDKYDQILILTANSATLQPQKEVLLSECGFDVDDARFMIYGCQDVPGFNAVAKGEAVDVEYVTPGMVKMTKDILRARPTIRAICLECTELPPYADALRKETGLPVFDAITCSDFFISARKDNPRFGLNQWQNDWDGAVNEYSLGQNLTAEQRSRSNYAR